MTTLIVEAVGLTCRFPAVTAVDHLDLAIPSGVIFGLLGPNGAGKTTTLRLMLGLLHPAEGTIRTCGHNPVAEGSAARACVGVLLEHTGLYERLSALENLEFFGRLAGMTKSDRRGRIETLLRHFGLWDRRRGAVGTWSRGMKQRLAIARALVHRPRLLLLDEPTEGLDPVAAASLREDIAALARSDGVSVVLTTHDLVVAERLCEQIGIMRAGRLIARGSVDSLRDESQLRVFTVPLPSESISPVLATLPGVRRTSFERNHVRVIGNYTLDLAHIRAALSQAGFDTTVIAVAAPSLEDIYLALMGPEANRVD